MHVGQCMLDSKFGAVHAELMQGSAYWALNFGCTCWFLQCWAVHIEHFILGTSCWTVHVEQCILGSAWWVVHGGLYNP